MRKSNARSVPTQCCCDVVVLDDREEEEEEEKRGWCACVVSLLCGKRETKVSFKRTRRDEFFLCFFGLFFFSKREVFGENLCAIHHCAQHTREEEEEE